jgi:RNA polymerase subunit RPABC4/transcription elongation factor Spt4
MFLVSWPGGSWQSALTMGATVFALYFGVLWLTLIYWTYRDIRRRSRDPIVQMVAVLVVLVFFLPGHWVYLILRPRQTLTELYDRSLEEEALLQELEDQKACPTCKRRVHDDFLICPSCRTRLKEPCRSCAKPLSYAWVACPYCGLEKPPREGTGQRATRAPGAARPAPAQAVAPGHRPAPQPTQQSRSVPATDPFAATRPRPTVEGDDAPIIGA